MTDSVIHQGDVLDEERSAACREQVAPTLVGAGGRRLVRGGDAQPLEGVLPASRTVVLAFPTRQAALHWYNSEDDTAIRRFREGAAGAIRYVVDGVDQPDRR